MERTLEGQIRTISILGCISEICKFKIDSLHSCCSVCIHALLAMDTPHTLLDILENIRTCSVSDSRHALGLSSWLLVCRIVPQASHPTLSVALSSRDLISTSMFHPNLRCYQRCERNWYRLLKPISKLADSCKRKVESTENTGRNQAIVNECQRERRRDCRSQRVLFWKLEISDWWSKSGFPSTFHHRPSLIRITPCFKLSWTRRTRIEDFHHPRSSFYGFFGP